MLIRTTATSYSYGGLAQTQHALLSTLLWAVSELMALSADLRGYTGIWHSLGFLNRKMSCGGNTVRWRSQTPVRSVMDDSSSSLIVRSVVSCCKSEWRRMWLFDEEIELICALVTLSRWHLSVELLHHPVPCICILVLWTLFYFLEQYYDTFIYSC